MKHKFSYEIIRNFVKISNESEDFSLLISVVPQPRKKLHKDIEIVGPGCVKYFEKSEKFENVTDLYFRWLKK